MKTKAINFVDRKIENCYDYEIFALHLPKNWLNCTLQEQEEWFKKVNNFINQSKEKSILFAIHYCDDDYLDQYEQLQLISKVAEQTITEEETGRNYLSIPTWFKEHIFCSVDIQKKLGNFKNKFEKLQIELYYNDEVLERLVE